MIMYGGFMKKIVKKNWFVILVFFFYLIISALIPFSGDDWTWAGKYGIDRLSVWFNNYNGRYLGNITEIAITRVFLIRILLFSVINTGIFVLISKLIGRKSFLFNISIMLLLLSMPTDIYRQTYGWFAGFANYNTSIFLTLLSIYLLKKNAKQPMNFYFQILCSVLFIANQLFVEHMTLFNLLLAIFLFVISLVKKEKITLLKINFLLSSFIGAIIMFSNRAYFSILNHSDSYRTIGATDESLIKKIYHTITLNWMNQVVTNNWIINLLISSLIAIIVFKYTGKTVVKKNLTFIASFLLLFSTWSFYKSINHINSSIFGKYFLLLESASAILFLCGIIIAVLVCINDNDVKWELTFYGVSAIVCVAPFLILEPFGPRCVLSTYVFYILFVYKLISYIFDQSYIKLSQVTINSLTLLVLGSIATLCLSYTIVTYKNHKVSLSRLENAVYSQSEKTLLISKLPFEQFTQQGSPVPNSVQETTFKEYFNIDAETKIRFVNYQWKVYK